MVLLLAMSAPLFVLGFLANRESGFYWLSREPMEESRAVIVTVRDSLSILCTSERKYTHESRLKYFDWGKFALFSSIYDDQALFNECSGELLCRKTVFICPRWFPFVPAGLLACWPLFCTGRGLIRLCRRRQHNHCRRCNYDLTGNISGTCPECGKPVRACPTPLGSHGFDSSGQV